MCLHFNVFLLDILYSLFEASITYDSTGDEILKCEIAAQADME